MNRPLIEMPSWDGKIVLAGIFIVGYYALVLIMATRGLPSANIDLVRDAMLTLGPPIGMIFHALFRNTAAEERREALRSTEVQAALSSAPHEVQQVEVMNPPDNPVPTTSGDDELPDYARP